MSDRAFAISIGDTQTLYATSDPQDQDQLTELFVDGTIQLREAEGDVAGHALSTDVLVDVEGHAIALRLPTPADAEALRQALMVGAVTATLVAAGAIASLQSPAQPASTVIDTTRSTSQGAPAQMVRADEAQAIREQGYANAQAAAQAAAMAEARNEIPTAQDRADRAEQLRQQTNANSQVGSPATTSSVEGVAPAPALRADEAQSVREQSYANSQAAAADDDVAIPGPAQRADEAEKLREGN